MISINKVEQRRTPVIYKESENKVETPRVAETLGKFSKMRAKNDSGDKSGNYGSRG